MSNKKYVVFLGNSGFPYGFAGIQKIILISKCLILKGNHVTVICEKGTQNKSDYPDLQHQGIFENIEYVYTSGSPFRDNSFIKRNLLKIKGLIGEISYLRKRRKSKTLDHAIISSMNFYSVLFYFFLSKIYRFKIILNYVEFYSSVKKKWYRINARLNDYLFDKYAPALTDAALPISEFLIGHLQKVSPGKKYLKIPGLTDFEKYNNIEILNTDKYFLYCGAAGYREVIDFIIDAFTGLDNTDTFLYLVVNGDGNSINSIKEYICNSSKKDKIKLLSRLTEKELYTYYQNAIALLIPLRPTFQDLARFPHKTGEYMGSANPVISVNYGEIKYYFKDMENILLAENYDVAQFADKMKFVIDHPGLAKEIGTKGKEVALNLFHYKNRALYIDDFFNSKF